MLGDRRGHHRDHEGDRDHRAGVLKHRAGASGDAAALGRDGAHHRGGVGGVEHPRSDPDQEQVEAALPVGALGLKQGHQSQGAGPDQHSQRRERTRAVAVGPDPRQRRGDQHPDRHRGELDAGRDRIVALGALEVEDEDEQQRKAREPVDERGPGCRGEEPVAEDREVEHRGAAAVLDVDEERQQHGGGDQPADHQRPIPTGDAALGDAIDEPRQSRDEGGGSNQVEAALGVLLGELMQHEASPQGAQKAERDVEPEDPVPGDRDQHASEDRAEHQPNRRHHRVGAHRQPELPFREGIGDQGRGVGEDERAGDPLHDPPEDQLGPAGGESGAKRGSREDQKCPHVGALAAEQVGEAPRGEDQNGRGDHVGEDHPDELQERRMQGPLEVGEGDDQSAGVDRRQQHPEAGARQSPPFVVRMLGGNPGPPSCISNVHVKKNFNARRAEEPGAGLEPATPSLPWKCSTN